MTREEGPLTVVLGVGSRMRGDDSLGPYVIDILKERMDEEGCSEGNRLSLIDADVMPENFTRPIRESGARTCILVDAVDVKLDPGAIRRIPEGRIDATIPCSHSLPLSYVMKYIGEKIDNVLLIGVQIGTTGLYKDMTPDVKRGGEELADVLWNGEWEKIRIYDPDEPGSDREATNYCW